MRKILYGVMGAMAGLAAFAAGAAMTADQIRQQIERESGGKVIKIEPRKFGALDAFAVTILNSGGNDNAAFQVYTVIVSAENGTIVPEHRQTRHY